MSERRKCLLYTAKILFVCLAFSGMLLLLTLWVFWMLSIPGSLSVAATPTTTYVLDAGHGGRDGGAVSADGTTEKELNLAITACVRDYLLLCGEETVMTRVGDTLLCDESDPKLKGRIKATDLQNRLQIAHKATPSVLVSIHMNKFAIEKYSGLQVYFSPNHSESYSIAKRIQERVQQTLQPENEREIKAAGSNIYLLDRVREPAVLIECGFLSNCAETEKLKNPTYQMQLASVIADSLLVN